MSCGLTPSIILPLCSRFRWRHARYAEDGMDHLLHDWNDVVRHALRSRERVEGLETKHHEQDVDQFSLWDDWRHVRRQSAHQLRDGPATSALPLLEGRIELGIVRRRGAQAPMCATTVGPKATEQVDECVQ